MNNYIMLFISLANIIAVVLVYYSFGKGTKKQKKIINSMITIGIAYILTLIIYWISSIGIQKNSVSDMAKTMITMSFVPVNTIIFAPFLIHSYTCKIENKIKIEQLNKRVIIMAIVAVLTFGWEISYFKQLQNEFNRIQNELNVNSQTNNQINEINEESNSAYENNETNNTIE